MHEICNNLQQVDPRFLKSAAHRHKICKKYFTDVYGNVLYLKNLTYPNLTLISPNTTKVVLSPLSAADVLKEFYFLVSLKK
jgi:hypothetical protein